MSHKQAVLAAVLTGALPFTSAYAQTPDSVQTRLGSLSFENGYPSEETARKLFDEMDYQRAVQAYLLPIRQFRSSPFASRPMASSALISTI
jgi:hypothetical protein